MKLKEKRPTEIKNVKQAIEMHLTQAQSHFKKKNYSEEARCYIKIRRQLLQLPKRNARKIAECYWNEAMAYADLAKSAIIHEAANNYLEQAHAALQQSTRSYPPKTKTKIKIYRDMEQYLVSQRKQKNHSDFKNTQNPPFLRAHECLALAAPVRPLPPPRQPEADFSYLSCLLMGAAVALGSYALSFTWPTIIGHLLATTGLSYVGLKARNTMYQNQLKKLSCNIKKLPQPEKSAYKDGLKSSNSYLNYYKSFLKPNDWKHVSTFGAGMVAGMKPRKP